VTTADLVDEVEERLCIALEHDWRTWYGHRFSGRRDNLGVPHRWNALDLLRMVLQPVVGTAKNRLPLWGPTTYGLPFIEEGKPVCRRASNAELLSMVVLDVDDGTSVDELIEPGVFCLAHTSWSHTPDAPKWRIIYPLAEPVPAAQWGDTWRGVAAKWPSIDPSTKDPSRIYYVPAVRQSMPLCRAPKRLAYRRGTYEARLQLGRWLTPPAPPPAPERLRQVRAPGRVDYRMLSGDRRGRYGAAIARARVERVATAGKGQRNTHLFGAAVDCRRLGLAGVVDWAALEGELRAAAEQCGLKGGEVSQTIASATRKADAEGAWNDWG
jgi:hypothetical protein